MTMGCNEIWCWAGRTWSSTGTLVVFISFRVRTKSREDTRGCIFA